MPDPAQRLDGRPCSPEEVAGNPERFDYTESAELFTHLGMIAGTRTSQATPARTNASMRMQRRKGVTYHRFANSAEAVRFAVEELPRPHLLASVLVVSGERYEVAAILDLYTSNSYPLVRTSPKKRSQRQAALRVGLAPNKAIQTARTRKDR